MDSKISRRNFIKLNSLAGVGITMAASPLAGLSAITRNNNFHEPAIFFDAYTRFGAIKYKHPAEPWKLSDLVAEHNHCSVSGGLVANTQSVFYDAMFGNLQLSNMLSKYKSLYAIWNVIPDTTDEFLSLQKLETQMKEHNVRAVSIYPDTNAWDWRASFNQPLLKWLEANKILTITSQAEIGSWHDLDMFLATYPNLQLMITGAHWAEQRYLIPLMEKYKNLHCTLENLQNMNGIEYMCKHGLENQILFGSNAPVMSAGAHRTFVDYAAVSETVRAKIAADNLTRLLKGLKPSTIISNNNEDALMNAVRHGKPLPSAIIDMHMHVLHQGMNGAGWGYTMEDGDPAGTFNLIKKLGYTGGGLMSWNGVVSSDSVEGNITTQLALNEAPKGYWGLANFDPTHYTQEELEKMIPEFYKNHPAFIGMKPYHYIGVLYNHPSWDVWWNYGNDNHFYALIHTQQSSLFEIEALARKYPNVRWLIAHSGQSYGYADKVIAVINKFPNVYAEITLTPVPNGVIDYLVAGAGEDKILYGSDLPMRDPRPQLGWVVFSRLSEAAKRKILHANAIEVIRPCLDKMPIINQPDI
ncbi:MAG: amidohydrolase family protein [Agriterribacter sp.]